MTIKCEINSRDWAEALLDAACYRMAITREYGHTHDAAGHLARCCGIRDEYVEEEILRVRRELMMEAEDPESWRG